MARRKIEGLRTIVTGATSGIGRAIALELARQGANLVVTGRRQERLDELVASVQSLGANVITIAGDIATAKTRQALVDAAANEYGGLDVLINNAGVGALGPFVDADEARLRQVMEVNFFAPVELIRLALPVLRQGNKPIICNVGSVLGHRAVAKKSEYCASKFAMHGFTDALRCELASEGIDVLLVSPSTTSSEFFEQAIAADGASANVLRGAISPNTVARKTVAAIRKGKHEIILSPGGKALVWLDRLSPPLMNRILARFS